MVKFRLLLEKAVLSLITVFLVLLVVMASWQVFARYVLNDPPQFTDEALRFTMIWLVYLGAALAFGRADRHMSLGLLKDMFSGWTPLAVRALRFCRSACFLPHRHDQGGHKSGLDRRGTIFRQHEFTDELGLCDHPAFRCSFNPLQDAELFGSNQRYEEWCRWKLISSS